MNHVQLAVVGGGVGALWTATTAARQGISVALVTSGPIGAYASTGNQGWLHSGALYAANNAQGLAEHCAQGARDVSALAARTGRPILSDRDGVFFAPDAAGLELAVANLGRTGLPYQVAALDTATSQFLYRGSGPMRAIHTADRAIDTLVLLRSLVDESIEAGALVVATTTAPRLETAASSSWTITCFSGTESFRLRADTVLVALGPATGDFLGANGLSAEAVPSVTTRTRVLVLPQLPVHSVAVPLFEVAPTLVPIWHGGRVHGATMCMPFDNQPGNVVGHPDPQSTAEFVSACLRHYDGVAAHPSWRVGRAIGVYECTKTMVEGAEPGTEASRSFRVTAVAEGLTAYYAGKFTTASVGVRSCLASLGWDVQTSRKSTAEQGTILGRMHFSGRPGMRSATHLAVASGDGTVSLSPGGSDARPGLMSRRSTSISIST